MIITSAKSQGQLVNKIGKALYKYLDGAYKIDYSPNMCDVYITLYYQLPKLQRIPGKGREYNDVHEMTLDLNITTYSGGIRVYVIELTPEERTICYFSLKENQLGSTQDVVEKIKNQVIRQVSRKYEEYDFIF